MSPALAGGFFTTEPSGSPGVYFLSFDLLFISCGLYALAAACNIPKVHPSHTSA